MKTLKSLFVWLVCLVSCTKEEALPATTLRFTAYTALTGGAVKSNVLVLADVGTARPDTLLRAGTTNYLNTRDLNSAFPVIATLYVPENTSKLRILVTEAYHERAGVQTKLIMNQCTTLANCELVRGKDNIAIIELRPL
jgi:hypothetical protein